MDFFQNGKSLGNQLSADDLLAMQDSQTGDRGYAKLSDVIVEGVNSLVAEQRAAVRAGIGVQIAFLSSEFSEDSGFVLDASAKLQDFFDSVPDGAYVRLVGEFNTVVKSDTKRSVLINRSVYVDARGATFNISSDATPISLDQERSKTVFLVSSVDGFGWAGGVVFGGRGDLVNPRASFIVGNACNNTTVDSVSMFDIDNYYGSVYFNSYNYAETEQFKCGNIRITNNNIEKCASGLYVEGSFSNVLVSGNSGKYIDFIHPNNGVSRYGETAYFGKFVYIGGFGDDTSVLPREQYGIVVSNNIVDYSSIAIEVYNSYGTRYYITGSEYETSNVVVSGNVCTNVISGIHANAVDGCLISGNLCSRAEMSASDISSYAGTAHIASTVGIFGQMIEASTVGRKMNVVGNTVRANYDLAGGTDYTGIAYGISVGRSYTTIPGGTADESSTGVVSGNYVSGLYRGIVGTGTVAMKVSGNRIEGCFRAFWNNYATAITTQQSPEGVFSDNTILNLSYGVSAEFHGNWIVSANQLLTTKASGNAGQGFKFYGTAARIRVNNNYFEKIDQPIVFNGTGAVDACLEGNLFSSVYQAVTIPIDSLASYTISRNTYKNVGSCNVFSGTGTHGNYQANDNVIHSSSTCSWVSDGAAPMPTLLGHRTSAPAAGTHCIGAKYMNNAPAAAGYIGWVCTAGGAPGTWKTYGSISA